MRASRAAPPVAQPVAQRRQLVQEEDEEEQRAAHGNETAGQSPYPRNIQIGPRTTSSKRTIEISAPRACFGAKPSDT